MKLFDGTLPYDAEIEYLESTGTQYIDTGYYPNETTNFESRFTTNVSKAPFAVRWTGSPTYNTFGLANTGTQLRMGVYFGRYSNNQYKIIDLASSGIQEVNLNATTITVNGTDVSISRSSSSFTSTYPLHIFGLNNIGDSTSKGVQRIYNLKLKENNITVHDFIPVRKGSVGYMYDRVSGQLFGNAGTGNFVLGGDIVPVEYLESDGNAYIDTSISSKNAKIGCDVTFAITSQYSPNKYIFGCSSRSTNDIDTLYIGTYTIDSSQYFISRVYDHDRTVQIRGNIPFDNNYHNIKMNCLGIGIEYDGTITSTDQVTYGSGGRTVYIFNFNYYNQGNYKISSRFKQVRLYKDNNVLVRDFIPVRVGTTGYMYDRVSGQLFGNSGTGDFTFGDDIVPMNYLESTGTQYIDTGISLSSNFACEVKAKFIENQNGYDTLLGSMGSGGNNDTYGTALAIDQDGRGYIKVGGGGMSYASQITTPLYTHTYKTSLKDGVLTCDIDGVSSTSTFSGAIPSSSLYLFARNKNNSAVGNYSKARIYSCKIWNNDTLVRDFVPVCMGSVGYLYDKVTRQLFGNSGEGNFLFSGDIVPIEYLESIDTQWIDTGYYPNGATEFESRFQTGTSLTPFAVRWTGSPTYNTFGLISSSVSSGTSLVCTAYFGDYSNSEYKTFNITTTNVHEIKLSTNTVTVDGTTLSISRSSFTSTYPLWIFRLNNQGSGSSVGNQRIYFLKIKEGNSVVHDFIPVRVGSVGFMYDRVSGQLFGNSGTGDFILGQDIVPVEYLEGDGNAYISANLSVSLSNNTNVKWLGDIGISNLSDERRFLFCPDNKWGTYLFCEIWHNKFSVGSASSTGPILEIDKMYACEFEYTIGVSTICKIKVGQDEYTNTLTSQGTIPSGLVNFNLFRIGVYSGNPYAGEGQRIGRNQIFYNGVLLRDFIPVRVGTTGYMYDKVNNRLYANAGTGSFTYGNDTPDVELIVIPTEEIPITPIEPPIIPPQVVFNIYNSDNEPFHNLVLRNATYDSSVMSLSDKISGFVYYKDNSLPCTMHEYIVYEGVKYTLVNPPTIVCEGLVADNSELNGMTKYTMEFYHPMVMLSDFPFTDIAVSNDELRYKSQDKSFTWVGYIEDYVAKLNKNLQSTQWVCELSENIDNDTLEKFSDVLTFSDNTIADALKTAYDTWDVPYIIDVLPVTDDRYTQGKRYLISFGEPSNEIFVDAEDKVYEIPYVFQFGQGVGLKNNSVTPRNNKIVTRIAAYGSEQNIPFGYPQIPWTGDSSWDFTIENDGTNPLSHPIYKGIYGGQWVKLIKHPFTRKHLMPSIYAETIAKKVDPNNDNYNPDIAIVDYHDALDGETYAHTINPNAPSYEIHEFEDIFPELGTQHIIDAYPINDDMTDADDWVDSMNDSGDYEQGYFKLTLPLLGFDLYACVNITEQMQINMRSGACIGCTFEVQVDWEEYKLNFYDTDGNFVPDGSQRNLEKYPKTNTTQVTLICKKDIDTFGTIMPNVYQKPKGTSNDYDGDEFVILGISLPTTYITDAQTRLDTAMDKYMLENNVYYFEYPLKFDEYFLVSHPYILNQIRNNTIIRFGYNDDVIPLYVKQITIKYGEKPLPEYNITLTDNVEVSLNQIGQANEAIGKMEIKVNALKNAMGKNVEVDLSSKLSRVSDDVANGIINFAKGLTAGNFMEDLSGFGVFQNRDNNWVIEADYFHVRKKLEAESVEIMHASHVGGRFVATAAAITISDVQYIDNYIQEDESWQGACYKCYFKTTDSEGNQIYNTFMIGDLAYCETFNLVTSSDGVTYQGTGNHFYWRKVIDVGTDYICLSNEFGEYAADSDYPFIGDNVTLLGSQANVPSIADPNGTHYTERQNAIIIAGAGAGNPYIRVYKGIDSFSLPTPAVQISPYGSWITVQDNDGQDVRIDQLVNNLYDQVEQVREQDDKQIVLWFGSGVPTSSGEPESNWVTDQIRHEHVKDIYYDRAAGKAYSYEETIEQGTASYSWELLTDQDVLRSLELAAQAQDTADGKRRVFVERPTQAQIYDIGDLWVNATFPTQISDGEGTFGDASGVTHTIENPLYNNDILRCVTAKAEGAPFNISHWQPVQHYTTSQITQTTDQIKLEVMQGLESTGIDITSGLIQLNAAKTVVSDTLAVKRVETTPDTSTNVDNQAKVTIAGSEMNVFGANGIVNIKFGVDEDGYAVLKYYDRDGTFLYDLGPRGLNFLEVAEARMNAYYYVKMTNGLPDHSENMTGQEYLYFFRPKRIGGMIKGDSTYTANDDAIATEASGRAFISTAIVSGGQLDTTQYATGLWRSEDNIIYTMADLEVFGSIADAQAYLMANTGLSQEDLEDYDWSLNERQVNQVLNYAIHWQEYTFFVQGIGTPVIYVWQDNEIYNPSNNE